jgi:hypothetical protein
MTTVSLVLGIIGSVTGIAALAWNIVAFSLSGHRVNVEITNGMVISLDEAGRPQLPGTWNLTVRVWNGGRQAFSVVGIELAPADVKLASVAWTQWVGPDFAHRLEGQAEASWRCDSPQVLTSMLRYISGEEDLTGRAVVVLPGGKKKRSNLITMDEAKALEEVGTRFVVANAFGVDTEFDEEAGGSGAG